MVKGFGARAIAPGPATVGATSSGAAAVSRMRAAAAPRFGRGPIRRVPCCGVPVSRSALRIWTGVSGDPKAARAIPSRQSAEPATIGEAPDVPLNEAV